MAVKLTRQTLQQFGATVNAGSEIGQFGSGATGSPVYTATLSVIQSLAAWSRGWAAETIANNRPFLEDMNAVDYVFGYQLSYMLQMGIPEYDAGTIYFLNSITQSGGIVYQCILDNSGSGISGIVPTNATFWKQLQKGLGIWTIISSGTIYQAATDGFVVAYGETSNSSPGGGFTIVSDSSSTPSTIRGTQEAGTNTSICMNIPVRKNDYFEVQTGVGNGMQSINVFFISLGS